MLNWYNKPSLIDFRIIFRDLSKNEKMNVQYLWDKECDKECENIPDKNQKKSKKEKMLDRILKQKQKKHFKEDNLYISDLEIEKINMRELKEKIQLMKTKKGQIMMKYTFLKKAYYNRDMNNVIDLYLELYQNYNYFAKKEIKLLERVKKKIKRINLYLFQLESLNNRLPPLDFYNNYEFKFEEWQKRVLKCIDQNKSVLVCAPTSSGKTILTTYLISKKLRVLYIVPTEPLAFQVISLFEKIINNKCNLLTDNYKFKTTKHYKDSCVLVSTPNALQQNLDKIKNNYDYIVYDEIHCLNYNEGNIGGILERLIKILKGNILALSATINNPKKIQEWWQKITKQNIELVCYDSRFINIQRHIVIHNKLEFLHPCSLITYDILVSTGFSEGELSFSPRDLADLWKKMEKFYIEDTIGSGISGDSSEYDGESESGEYTSSSSYVNEPTIMKEINDLKPDIYFKKFDTYRITLHQTKLYENDMKNKIIEMARVQLEQYIIHVIF